eukprot:NODE_557_length_2105_cov_22.345331_g513_i0.p1 GENE.NODE_557_length_2105_cov_22.345331_g513_i0~~NODE_557_length_2105_cov_22.345331_g513_i0.p1  ORF type:complete len:493 (+),score=106.65 NODE_557_length_2105_cov_22.345331_g513_i0:498-1976(+)
MFLIFLHTFIFRFHPQNSRTHISADSATSGVTPENKEAVAEGFLEEGHRHCEQSAFRDAVQMYSKAVALSSGPLRARAYVARASSWRKLGALQECISDCRSALDHDEGLHVAHAELGMALSELGRYADAVSALEKAESAKVKGAASKRAEVQEILKSLNSGQEMWRAGNISGARTVFTYLLTLTSAPPVALGLARVEMASGAADRALRLTLQLIKSDSSNEEAYCVRGQALCLSGDFDQAAKHLSEALRLNPDNNEAARTAKMIRKVKQSVTAADEAVAKRNFSDAQELYTEALTFAAAPEKCFLTARLHAGRAIARLRSSQIEGCLEDCAKAIAAQEDFREAWLAKASALHSVNRHEEALASMQEAVKIFPSDTRVTYALEKAQFEVKKARRPNYYALLGITSVASEVEIKAAYKVLALECHPDRLSSASESERAAAEEKFKLVGEGLEILTDPLKRQLYDEGHDKDAIEERAQAAQRAAHREHGCRGGYQ